MNKNICPYCEKAFKIDKDGVAKRIRSKNSPLTEKEFAEKEVLRKKYAGAFDDVPPEGD